MKSENYPLVSVIVPVYNAEKYLKKCVDSLLSQSYENLEIILSDDGSRDNSLMLCNEFKEKDLRIKVIHNENGGASAARNAGLDIANGNYISFVDSDDYIEKNTVELLLNAVKENDCSVSQIKSHIVSGDYEIIADESKGTGKTVLRNSAEYVKGMCEKVLSESVCDKLFDASLFKNRRFKTGVRNEDFYILSEMMFEDLTVAEVDVACYNYYKHSDSVTTETVSRKCFFDSIENAYELMVRSRKECPVLEKHFARLLLYQLRTLFITVDRQLVKEKSKEYLSSIKYLKESAKFIDGASLSRFDKIILKSVNLMPKTTIFILTSIWKLKSK